ncbi:SPW repeat protein [Streptomyces sp. NPDC005722]
MSRTQPGIEQHPDLLELRADYERATATNRGQAVAAMGLLTGTYLAASPWIVGFNSLFGFNALSTIAVSNLIAGIVYALLMGGVGRGFERTHSRAWAAAVIALWTIISPWCVTGNVSTTRTITNNVVVGVIGLVLALAAATLRPDSLRRGHRDASRSTGGLGKV